MINECLNLNLALILANVRIISWQIYCNVSSRGWFQLETYPLLIRVWGQHRFEVNTVDQKTTFDQNSEQMGIDPIQSLVANQFSHC